MDEAPPHLAATATAGELIRLALRFCDLGEALSKQRPEGGLSDADLAPLAAMVATADFRRIGIWRDEQTWPEYVAYMKAWAGRTSLASTVIRASAAAPYAFVELHERITRRGAQSSKNSMMVFEFDQAQKIRGLSVYEQNRDNLPAGGQAAE
jgi:hypothetical protein